jgi:ankyrin repeat protein
MHNNVPRIMRCCCRYTLLHVAAGLGQTPTLELLLKHLGSSSALINDSSNDDGATPLHAAAMAGSAAAGCMLLSNGADAGIAGADGTQAWELVPIAESASSAAKQQGAGQQQDMQELQRTLKEAARTAGRTQAPRSSKVTSRSEVATGTAAAVATQGPEEVYSEQFRQLSPAEQARKVEGFVRLPASELKSATHLSAAAKAAIVQVGAFLVSASVRFFVRSCGCSRRLLWCARAVALPILQVAFLCPVRCATFDL